jgi:hypothetical protein
MIMLGLEPNHFSTESLYLIPVKHAVATTLLPAPARCSPQLKFAPHCLLSRGLQSLIIVPHLYPNTPE